MNVRLRKQINSQDIVSTEKVRIRHCMPTTVLALRVCENFKKELIDNYLEKVVNI